MFSKKFARWETKKVVWLYHRICCLLCFDGTRRWSVLWKKYSFFDEDEEAYKLKPLYPFGLVGYRIFFWKDIEKWCTWSWLDFWAHCDESLFTQYKCYFGEFFVFGRIQSHCNLSLKWFTKSKNHGNGWNVCNPKLFSIFLKSTWSGSLVKQCVVFRYLYQNTTMCVWKIYRSVWQGWMANKKD